MTSSMSTSINMSTYGQINGILFSKHVWKDIIESNTTIMETFNLYVH